MHLLETVHRAHSVTLSFKKEKTKQPSVASETSPEDIPSMYYSTKFLATFLKANY